MALFPPEEVHFHRNEGGTPSVSFPGPARSKCVDCVPGNIGSAVHVLGDFCQTPHLYTSGGSISLRLRVSTLTTLTIFTPAILTRGLGAIPGAAVV